MNISSHRTIRLGQVIFLLMFPFLIAACSGLSLSEENPDSTDVSYLKNLQTLVKNEGRNDLGVYLSPDGNWFVTSQFDASIGTSMKIVRIADLQYDLIDLPLHSPHNDFTFNSWSPDNQAFAIRVSDELGKCLENRILLYKFQDGKASRTSIFEPGGDTACFRLSWAEDGSRLLVAKGGRDNIIYLLDREGKLLQKIVLGLPSDESFTQFMLFGTKLFLLVTKGPPSDLEYELKWADISQPDQLKSVFQNNNSFFMIDYNAEKDEILLNLREGQYSNYSYSLMVLSLDTLKTRKQVALKTDPTQYATSSPSKYVGAISNTPNDTRELNVFDWGSKTVSNYGEISFLIGWRPNVGGFLVLKSQGDEYSLDVIKPTKQ